MFPHLDVGVKFVRSNALCEVVSKDIFDAAWPREKNKTFEKYTFYKYITGTYAGEVYSWDDVAASHSNDVKIIACARHSANITPDNWKSYT